MPTLSVYGIYKKRSVVVKGLPCLPWPFYIMLYAICLENKHTYICMYIMYRLYDTQNCCNLTLFPARLNKPYADSVASDQPAYLHS